MDSMYEMLMRLPIFQGLSSAKMQELIEKTRFHFLKFGAGEKIASKGEECTHLKFLISGNVRMEIVNRTEKIKVTEVIHAPEVLIPNHMFGKNTYYPGSIFAHSDVGIMQIDKRSFMQIMQEEPIFLINLLNIISRQTQVTIESFMALSSGDMREKLALWIDSVTQRRSTDVRIHCKQKDLYSIFGVQRSVFINALNSLKEENILDYSTREIIILDRDKLRNILSHHDMDNGYAI